MLKKMVIYLLVAVMLLATLTACGQSNTEQGTENAASGQDKVEGTETAKTNDSNSGVGADSPDWQPNSNTVKILSFGGVDAYPMLTEKFTKETGCKAEYSQVAFNDLHTKLATLFAAKSSEVDIASTWAGWTAEFASAGFFEDITDRLSSNLKDDIVPLSTECITFNGRYYGVPRFYSIFMLFFNKKLFNEAQLDVSKPPETFDAWKEALQKLTIDRNNDGNPDTYGLLLSLGAQYNTSVYFEFFMAMQGSALVDEDDKILFNGEKGLKALEFMKWLNDNKILDPASSKIASGPDEQQRFCLGNIGYIISYSNTLDVANDPEKSKIVGELGWQNTPEWGGVMGTLLGSEGYAISKFSQNKHNAFKWIEYISSVESQKFMTLRNKWMPMRKSLLTDPEIVEMLPHAPAFGKQAEGFGSRCAKPYWSEVQRSIGTFIYDAMIGKIGLQEALDNAQQKAEEIIKKYKS